MRRRARFACSFIAVAALVATTFTIGSSPGQAADDSGDRALASLKGDASGPLVLSRDADGLMTFAGAPYGVSVNTPAVSRQTSVEDAAAAHLSRYGAAFGTRARGTTLTPLRSAESLTGDVVRYQQRVGGLPVLGGEFVVSLRSDRELDSILAHTSRLTRVPAARVGAEAAQATARTAFERAAGRGGAPDVTSMGRWVVDPALIGAPESLGIKTAYRFEITRGPHERRLVLVDDQTGYPLMNNDLITHAKNRIVCDDNNTPRNETVPCVSATPPARVEGGPATAVTDVDLAYEYGGAVSDTYLAAGGVDLTNLIGRDIGGGTKALAQTVRFCYSVTCPNYANAFWNGTEMYYGNGFASADDVVGHEMTHGVTERTSGLLYWGQSGAINESISDIMGEIVDHRNPGPGDSPTSWSAGEDLSCCPGGIRDMADPTLFNDPDKTSSNLYVKESCCSYPDNDGVHTNSGVGNKTFYLISQGGTFNGQSIAGIDTGDANLTKSFKLWLRADQTLSSGSDYADLAQVLEQSCAALRGSGVMTQANCAAVSKAVLATELRTTPVKNPQPADAVAVCPAGTTKRTLFDSETGNPAAKFTAGVGWSRNGIPGWGQNAHSNPDSWSSDENAVSGSSSLTVSSPVGLPPAQKAYLFFQHWRFLAYDGGGFYDAGTVEVNGSSAAGLPWVNGPSEVISNTWGNPKGGQLGFGGDSRGYLASRVDLSSFAGTSVTPQFSMNTDGGGGYAGWYVDDVVVYTCDRVLTGKVVLKGKPYVGKKLKAAITGWGPAGVKVKYQWLRNGKVIKGAKSKKYKLKGKDKGKKVSVRVTGTFGADTKSVTSKKKKIKKKKKK
ncbi:M4 family metallopeptidase [Nocardioides sp.]|uniref:M4 family metallopeptidase n=1 Tax=Nocardioides sp. TaxID=35761 RepID=UPI00356B11EF